MLFWLLIALPLVVSGVHYAPDIRGPFCANRPGGCCPGRIDNCAAPILGTLCYCDDFCNRTRNEDCCPDFWSHCKGIYEQTYPPETIAEPPVCIRGSQSHVLHSSWMENCNKCTCKVVTLHFNSSFAECERNECLVDADVIERVNDDYSLGWRAENYTEFWGRTLDDGVKLRLGTLQPQKTVLRMTPVKKTFDSRRLPRSFDARTKWRSLMQDVVDQGWCGASWAVSTAAVASDRFAIMTNGTEDVTLAPNHLLSCNTRGQRGCDGGHLDRAWLFMRKYGVVEESCYPYDAEAGLIGKCRIPRRSTLRTARCPPARNALDRTDMYRMGPAYKLGSEEDIMFEIQHSGPVQATMKVHQDFFSYRGGIYRQAAHVAHKTGYHSVRIVGWGEEGRTKYWLVANSWGSQWGENGYFRIQRGTDECEIEQFVIASWAQESKTIGKTLRNDLDNNLFK